MKRFASLLTVTVIIFAAFYSLAVTPSDLDADKAEIQNVVERSYLNGAFNRLDTEAMGDGFHPVFKIHGVREGSLSQYPIADWIASIEKRKAASDFDPNDQKWEYKFAMVDVTGVAGIAKIELFRKGEHVYTDYLSLLKLSDGWKITDKVYHRH